MKKHIVILVIIIVLVIGILGIRELFVKVNKTKIGTVENNKIYNISKTNEISKYIPNNIKKIEILNNLSSETNPTITNIEEINKIEEFMNLIFETKWEEISENQVNSKFNESFYQITLLGDYNTILKMQGVGGLNTNYGIVKIENKHYYINKSTYQKLTNFGIQKYYLHDSNLEIPNQDKCLEAQQKSLLDLTLEEKKNIQENIRDIHLKLEYELLDAVRLIKDKNSPYWEDFINYGIFVDPFTGVKVDNGGKFLYDLEQLDKIKDISKNEETRKDLQNAYNILKEGMNEHNLSKCFEAHKIIHDYDYFVINTPVYLKTEPADWNGVNTYFGTISIINNKK